MQGWGFFAFVRAVEFLAILIACVAFFNELNYRHEERTARAWQLLTVLAPGNSGKREALEYLNGRNIPLAGIDLTPPFLAEQWRQNPKEEREVRKRCAQFTYLREVELPEAILTDATLVCVDLQEANLRGARLWRADLRRSNFWGADLRGADLLLFADLRRSNFWRADLRGANIWRADLREARLWRADLRGANIWRADLRGADLQDADLRGANIWRTDLRQISGIGCSDLKQARAWETTYRDEDLACGHPIPKAPPPQP